MKLGSSLYSRKKNKDIKKWYLVYSFYDHIAKNAYASKISKSYPIGTSIKDIESDLLNRAKSKLLRGCEIVAYTLTGDKLVAKKDLDALWEQIYELRKQAKSNR